MEQLPWARLYWQDWLSDPAIRRLTPEQRGRFMDVWAATHGTSTPGVMTEEDVRLWCAYTVPDWKQVRDVFERCFSTTRQRGKWRLEDVITSHKAALEAFRTRQTRARKAVEARSGKPRSGNALATTSQLQVQLEVQPGVQPGVAQTLDTRRETEELERPTVPRLETSQNGGLSSAGSGGTEAAATALLERALRAGCADGTGNPQGGDA